MRLVFCGTPQFAVPTLQALLAAGHSVQLVLSQPDRPVGRHGEVHATPVKQIALAHGLSVDQPEKIKQNEALRATLETIQPDAIVVVAYGRIIPQWMLDLPKYGCINGHASLLPRWRGAAPIQWAIAGGDTETGVTTMLLNAGLDTGPMLLKRTVSIQPSTTSPELFVSLAEIGAKLMVETLAGLQDGSVVPQPQDETAATLAPILTRDDAHIDFTLPAQVIDRRFRAFQPWPGTYTALRGKKLIVHAMRFDPSARTAAEPGTLQILDNSLQVACGEGSVLTLDEVQLEGRRRMSAGEFLRGHQLRSGERLGDTAPPSQERP